MKLYTEEQVRKILKSTHIHTDNDVDMILPQFTPIELPSDEEIEELSVKVILYNDAKRTWWKVGAKWLRDKILNQNK